MKLKFKQIAFKFVKALAWGAVGAAASYITPENVMAALVAAGVSQAAASNLVLVGAAALGHAIHNIYDQKKP